MLIFLTMLMAAATALALHEFDHYVAARAASVPVLRINVGCGPSLLGGQTANGVRWSFRLFPLGGAITYPSETCSRPARLAVLAAGPIFNLVSGAAAAWIVPAFDDNVPSDLAELSFLSLHAFLWMFAGLSLAIGAFNLLPVPPLDGAAFVMTAFSLVTGRGAGPFGMLAHCLGLTIIGAATIGFGIWMFWPVFAN
jgi:membrane-associated protease RseP (regulator of RpoE activity)